MRVLSRRVRGDERGAIAVMIAIVSILLMICIAFAVDLGYAWQVKRSMVKATDASALAAAREARDQAVAKQTLGAGTCAPSAVETAASAALSANRSDATMDFCAISTSSGPKQGVVTVKATTDAQLSFSRIIGFNDLNVSSSTSAIWQQARLLPIAACAVKGNSSAADWVDDPSSPESVVLQASSADTSTLCSGGKSGAFGMIDLATNPSTSTSFDTCRTDDAAIATDMVDWIDNGYTGNISIDAYKCATVGQYYGTLTANVDRALCQIPQGSIVALPLVTANPKKKSDANSKQWIVQINGFALTSWDDYTGNNGTDLCSGYRTSGSGAPATPAHLRTFVPVVARHAAVAERVTVRKHSVRKHAARKHRRLVAARRSGRLAATSGDISIAQSGTWPSTVTNGSTTNLTVTVTNGSSGPVNDMVLRVTVSTTGGQPTVPIPSGCTAQPSGANQVIFTCTLKNTARNGTVDQTFSFTPVVTNPVTVTARVGSASNTNDPSDNNETSKTISVTAPTTTTTAPAAKSLVVTVVGSGTVTATPDGGQAVGTCTTSTSPCTFTYKNNTNVALTQTPGSGTTFSGWSQDCTGTGACSVTISASAGKAVTATFGATTTTIPATTTTVPIGSYRELHITLQTLLTGSGLTSDDLTVYRICDVNVQTAAAATTLTCN